MAAAQSLSHYRTHATSGACKRRAGSVATRSKPDDFPFGNRVWDPLVDRKGRAIVLNRYGQALLARVERVLQELDDAHKELTDLFYHESGTVSLAFLATFGTWLVPELMRSFRTQHENANFRLLQGPAPILLEHLLAGDVDLCLVSPRFDDPTVEWLPIGEEELFVLVPVGHRLAAKHTIGLKEVAEERFVSLKSGYGLRRVTDKLCSRAGFRPRVSFEGEEVATLWGLVGAGLGIGLGPRPAVSAAGSPVALRVSEPKCFRITGLAWAKKRYITSASRTFLEFMRTRYKRVASLDVHVPIPH